MLITNRYTRLWNASDGTEIRTFSGHSGWVWSVAFSPDGTMVLTGSHDRTAKLWNASDGTEIRTFSGHTSWVNSVAFSPDGTKVLTGSEDWTARLWNAADGREIRTFSGHTEAVSSVAFSPDGTMVLTGSCDQTAKLWNASDGTEIRTFSGHGDWVSSVAFSPDGTMVLTGSYDRTAKLWNAQNWTEIRTFWGHGLRVTSVAFSPDATKVLTGSDDSTAKLWNASDGTVLRTFSGHADYVLSVAFSPDGTKVLTGNSDRTAKLWNAADGTEIRSFSGHSREVSSVAFSPDGTMVLTGSSDRTAKLWNVSNGTLIRTFFGHRAYLESVAFSPNGTMVLAGSLDQTAKLWNASGRTEHRPYAGLPVEPHGVSSVAFSPDGTRVLTGGFDGTACLWQALNTADKVILVAGGGDFFGNPIVRQTKALADRAYFTSLARGYRRDEILYISAFDDWQTHDATGDGAPDVDAYATTQTFWSAIDSWSSDTARLLVYLIDHGSYNAQTGHYYFRLNQTSWIKAADLDAHLDALQAATGGEVILIVDCCYAGGFVQQCRATTGMRRIVIAATTPYNVASYLPPAGTESFSFYFLSFAIMGNTLYDCYYLTKVAFRALDNPAGQDPWLDDDRDGDSDKWDGALASRHVLGRYPAFGLTAPRILSVPPARAVVVGARVDLWAQVDEAVPTTQVWALLIPAGQQYTPDDPVTNLTRVDLARSVTPNRWEGIWVASEPSGFWSVCYFALSEDPLHTRLISRPVSRLLHVQGPTRASLPWHLLP